MDPSGPQRPPPGNEQRKRDARRPGRRRRKRADSPPSPVAVLARSQRADPPKSADAPLSPPELAEIRGHLRFLREYRKELRLRVNATEDLLLNGAREPTSRGVVQHLFAKLDRARVLTATEHLDPVNATRLAAGVLGICPDIEYVLLYLECVKRSTSQAQATAALSRGLEQIDFAQVSHAQMRRVLDLIVELFDPRQLPELLLGLLRGETFRVAFDASAESLPAALAELVVPLRAVQDAILRGRKGRFDTYLVGRGATLLLGASEETLLRFPADVRRRLFGLGLDACGSCDHTAHRGLECVLESLANSQQGYGEAALDLTRHLLRSGEEKPAARILRTVVERRPELREASRWLAALEPPRVGRVAAPHLSSPTAGGSRPQRRTSGWWLGHMQPVWLHTADPKGDETVDQAARLHAALCLPGVAPLLEEGQADDGRTYYAVPHPGQNLDVALDRRGGLSRGEALRVCGEAVSILVALAGAGARLPDAKPSRFDLLDSGELCLVDLSGALAVEAPVALQSHTRLARAFCSELVRRARRYVPPSELLQLLSRESALSELGGALARWRWP